MKFEHKVSKGSNYNQIYIPREMEQYFEAGDTVEVRLITKFSKLYYNHLKESDLSDFKRKLITSIFNEIKTLEGIEQVFIFGSFLTKMEGYSDIDILILTEKEDIEYVFYRFWFLLVFQDIYLRQNNEAYFLLEGRFSIILLIFL